MGPDGTAMAPDRAEAAEWPATERHASRRQAWRWALLVAAGWVVQLGLRVWLSRGQTVPLANPDESAYLIAARVLAGGPPTDFSDSTLYQGGYPLLITPVFWFTQNPVTVYHAVLVINAAVSAGLMPLAYLAGRRLGLGRLAAYLVAAVTALLPAGVFYAEYAMTDAIYPVLVLAWLLATHSWLTARSVRGQYAAAAGSALLAGYGYAVHSRGTVIVVGYVAVGILTFWRRLARRGTVAVAALALAAAGTASWALDRYLTSAMYPEGTRDLTAQMKTALHTVHGAINVLEMAAGQMWRLVLDSWGLAGIGLVAATAAIVYRGTRIDLRIMAALGVAVTVVTASTVPAALPPDQSQTWASGRYLDGMIVVFFLVGAVVLLRAWARTILGCAAGAAAEQHRDGGGQAERGHAPAVEHESPQLPGGHLQHEDHAVHAVQPDQHLARQGARAAGVHGRGQVAVQQVGRAERQAQRRRRGQHGAARRQAPPCDQDADHHVPGHHDRAPGMHRVGVPGQQGRADRRGVLASHGPAGEPAVGGEQPAEHDDRVDRIGHHELAVEQRGRQQRRHHGHAERRRAVQPQPAAGHVA